MNIQQQSIVSYTTPDQTVENIGEQIVYQQSSGHYRKGVYEVEAIDAGGITVKSAKNYEFNDSIPPQYTITGNQNGQSGIKYKTKGAYIDAGASGSFTKSDYTDNRDISKSKGINWKNVQYVQGDTYALRYEFKSLGFIWNGTKKRWEKQTATS